MISVFEEDRERGASPNGVLVVEIFTLGEILCSHLPFSWFDHRVSLGHLNQEPTF